MQILLESQSSDLLEECGGSHLNSPINGEITSQGVKEGNSLTGVEQRQILDLLLAPMSPNRLARHFFQVFRKKVSPWNIKQLLLSFKQQINYLNERFDKIAGPKVIILQIDETFKGQKVSILVVIDAITGYIFHLEWLDRRTVEVISTQLNPLSELLPNVKLVITDGASHFPEVVKTLCPDAFHQTCLIHVMRGLYPYLQSYKTKYHEHLRAYRSVTDALSRVTLKKKEKRYTRKKLVQKLTYWKQRREECRKKYNVVPYQKGILKKFPDLRMISETLNFIRAQIRSVTRTIENVCERELKLKAQRERTFKQKNNAWGEYMIKCRLLHRFYRTFNLKGETYEKERATLISLLQKKGGKRCKLIQEILRLLVKVSNLDTVNKADCPIQLDFQYINTNAIENVNSQIRPFLECLRKITNSDYIKTYFRVLRLYLNTRRPYSGMRCDTSPLERYGYDLRGKNYLDLLQDGLPHGPQYGLSLRNINVAKIAPNIAEHSNIERLLTI